MNTLTIDTALPTGIDHAAQVAAGQKPVGYEAVRFNALKHGILSRYTVLSHEDHADYESLVNSLMDEHRPVGATEQHLVEEMASVIWRKRRVLQAEGATINRGLKVSARNAHTVVPAAAPFEFGLSGEDIDLRDVMDQRPEDVLQHQQATRHDLQALEKAATVLRKGAAQAYDKALRLLHPDHRESWQGEVDGGKCSADASGLNTYLGEQLMPLCVQMDKEARHHEAIVNQAVGEGLNLHKLETVSRYETHLDRKFERTLAMLIKLKSLRNTRAA
jgi:hypothetical protein